MLVEQLLQAPDVGNPSEVEMYGEKKIKPRLV